MVKKKGPTKAEMANNRYSLGVSAAHFTVCERDNTGIMNRNRDCV